MTGRPTPIILSNKFWIIYVIVLRPAFISFKLDHVCSCRRWLCQHSLGCCNLSCKCHGTMIFCAMIGWQLMPSVVVARNIWVMSEFKLWWAAVGFQPMLSGTFSKMMDDLFVKSVVFGRRIDLKRRKTSHRLTGQRKGLGPRGWALDQDSGIEWSGKVILSAGMERWNVGRGGASQELSVSSVDIF